MKILALAAFLSTAVLAQTPAHTQHFPNIKTGTYINGAMGAAVPPSLRNAVNAWMGARFDWILGGDTGVGDAHGGYPTKVYWAAFKDMPSEHNTEVYDVEATALNNSFMLENMYLHSSVDMAYSGGNGYTSQTAQFDFMEPYNAQKYGYGTQGAVFTYNGSTYTDVTCPTWASGGPTCTTPDHTTIANTLYVGFMEPYDQMNVTITTPRSGGTVAYKYWNGTTWATLSMSSPNSDGTSGLTTSGKVYFYPPSDWIARTLPVNETSPIVLANTTLKFWVAIVVTGASTSPIYTTIHGDDWSVSSSGNNFRGWSSTDIHRINVGTRLEYNPTPPANASAHFRYQARVTSSGQNLMYGNPSDVQGGVRTWGRFLADTIDVQLATGYDAGYFDRAGDLEYPPSPANAWQYYDFNQKNGWAAEWGLAYANTVSILKSEHGTYFDVGTNGPLPGSPVGSTTVGDFVLSEQALYTPGPTAAYGYNQSVPYDWSLPAHNPNAVQTYFQCGDPWSLGVPWASTSGIGMSNWHYADRGNRTPLMCLAMHYLGSNQNTGFMYGGGPYSWNGYYSTDQVYTYLTPTTLTAPIAADRSGASKTIQLASASSCGNMLRLGPTTGGDDVIALPSGVMIEVWGGDQTLQSLTGASAVSVRTGQGNPVGSPSKFSNLTWGAVTPKATQSVAWSYWNGTRWAALTITSDTTNGLTQAGKVSWTPPSDWATTTLPVTPNALYYVQWTITYSPEIPYFNFTALGSDDWTTFSTAYPIYNSYSSGDPAVCVQVQHLSVISSPSASNVYAWTRWFPAMGIDIGTPDPAGMNGGARMVETPWKTGGAPDYISGQAQSACSAASKCPDVWRRDFTKAIVLYRPWRNGVSLESELDTLSRPIALGGSYSPLKADGTLGGSVTSVSLRGGEGAILMKGANGPAVICNAGPQQTFRAGFPAQLDGSGSYALDGRPLSYLWQQLSGPDRVRWSNRSSAQTTISGLVFGSYVFQLTVTDSSNQSNTCTVKDGAVATDLNGVVVTNNSAVDTLLGPLVRLGANPWPWFDDRHRADADLQIGSMDTVYPAWWDTSGPGTLAVTAGSNTITGTGTTFSATFCQGPANPTAPKTNSVIAVWYNTGVPGQTGRRMSGVTDCTDDTHLTVDDPWDSGVIPAGSGLSYAADDATTHYATNWGWGQANSPGNYYDNVAAYYALYYRSGIDDYLTAARKLADRVWRSPMIDRGASEIAGHGGRYGFAERSISALGLVLRALELQGMTTDMWPGLHHIWDTSMGYLTNAANGGTSGTLDTRGKAYHLAMVSYCALYDSDPSYRANCQTAAANSFANIWTPSLSPDGSWPQLFYSLSSWDSQTSVSMINGSQIVAGNGTAWIAGNYPATIWFTNDPANRPPNNYAGDPQVYSATFVDANHLSLDRPYQGTSGMHGWASVAGTGMLGWGAQPAQMGVLAFAFDLAAKALAGAYPPGAALAQNYRLTAANWIRTYGYWPLQKGLYLYAQGINCQAPISDANSACTGGNAPADARALSPEALRGVMAAYASSQDSGFRDFADTLYNAMFAKPNTCTGATPCVPDGYYVSGLDTGGYMMTGAAPLGNAWFGMVFGFNNLSAWPAYRVGGLQPSSGKTLYAAFNLGRVRGAIRARLTATAPSGSTVQVECSSSPCAVTVDNRQGKYLIELQYLSGTGAVLATTEFPL